MIMLALVTDAFGGRGGIAQYNRDLITALANADRVIYVLPRHAPDKVLPPSPRIRQQRRRRRRPSYVAAAVALALRTRPTTIFCGHLHLTPLAAAIARIWRARLVVQFHGIEAWERPTPMRRAAVEAADVVLCVSRDTRARLLNWAGIAPERAIVLPDTVSSRFCPGDRDEARRRLQLDGKEVILTVGRLDSRERYKGHDRVIAALPDLIARGHDLLYLIGGEGDDRIRLESLAASLGMTERVRFLGAVPADALADTYRAANLFVMPSTGEGFGIAFLESMACGTPALGLPAAGARDALCDGSLGVLATDHTLAQSISDALRIPPLGGSALAERVRACYGFDQFAMRAALLFDSM